MMRTAACLIVFVVVWLIFGIREASIGGGLCVAILVTGLPLVACYVEDNLEGANPDRGE